MGGSMTCQSKFAREYQLVFDDGIPSVRAKIIAEPERIGPLHPDHLAVGKSCRACGRLVESNDYVTLIIFFDDILQLVPRATYIHWHCREERPCDS
jgi:hypothetical protein